MKKAVIHVVAAARPNFVKVAPLHEALQKQAWCQPVLIHTGQHYDAEMSDRFFDELRLPQPDIRLDVGSGTHAEQTAAVLVRYEATCLRDPPDWVIVVGDVNSTLAAALAAKKLCLPVAHLEAGLRSGDRTMPEEINRIITDAIADLLWTHSPDAVENLRREGVPDDRIEPVGNIMIDSLERMRPAIEAVDAPGELGLTKGAYGVVTLHRPVNVDTEDALRGAVCALVRASERIPLVFPVHPRTANRLEEFGLTDMLETDGSITTTPALGYLRFMSLVHNAGLVITDSGGVQEETTYLGIPCLTVRDTTERPITLTQGTNRLVNVDGLVDAVAAALEQEPEFRRPDMWDGRTAERVVASLAARLA